jgi:hypothetical protein
MAKSEVVSTLLRNLRYPVVSMGILSWIRVALGKRSFTNTDSLIAWMPRFLELLRCIVDTHRVQWVAVFEILRLTATLRTDLEVKVRHPILASTA